MRNVKARTFARKSMAVACAAVLALGMVPTAALATVAPASDGVTASSSSQDAATQTANSWRYDSVSLSEGDGLSAAESDDQSLAASTEAWSYVDGHYVNDQGEVIDRAVRKGVDVSAWQGTIDWEKVQADGVDYAIIRCGWGDNITSQDDRYFDYNVSECERLGIPYGVYLYSYGDSVESARSEAEHVLRLLEGHNPTYPVYLDLEESSLAGQNQLLANMATVFCEAIQAAGYTPGIYSSTNWWNNYLTSSVFNQWERWVAQWNHSCTYKGDYHMWQCASDGHVDGISGYADIDFEMDWAHNTEPRTFVEEENPSETTLEISQAAVTSVSADSQVLDVVAGSLESGANVTTWSATGANWQRYDFVTDEEGFTRIVNCNSGLALGVDTDEPTNATNVCQLEQTEGARVQWVVEEATNGAYYFRLRGTNLYMDVAGGTASDGTNISLWTESAMNGRRGQMFYAAYAPMRTIADGTYCVSSIVANAYCLTVEDASQEAGANVEYALNNHNGGQIYRVAYDPSDGYYTLVSAHSGQALDVVASGWESGTNVSQWYQTGEDNQKWEIVDQGDGRYALLSKCNDLYLTIDGEDAVEGDNPNICVADEITEYETGIQTFTFGEAIADGYYVLRSADNTDYVADVVAGSDEDGANVTLWNYTGARNQIFQIYHLYASCYKIVATNSWRALDVVAGGMENGTNVTQWSQYDSPNQTWVVEMNDDGTVSFWAQCSGLYLDVQGGYAGAGVNLQTWEATDNNGGRGQRFVLEETTIE